MSDAGEMTGSGLTETHISQPTYRECMLPASPSRNRITQISNMQIFIFRYFDVYLEYKLQARILFDKIFQ